MRVHLLLILFFVSTILARSARNRRDTNVTTEPPRNSTTEANNGSTTDVTGDECNGINCGNNMFKQPLKMMSTLIRSTLLTINKTLSMFLKALKLTGNFMLRAMIQPFAGILKVMIEIMKPMLEFI